MFENGVRYHGEFKFWKWDGFGRLSIDNSRHEYIGNWKKGKMHGNGKFTTISGIKYAGKWENDLFNGKRWHELP